MPAKPVASVVIATRNRAGYLAVALESLAAQRLDGEYEVVVADDGSTDATPDVTRSGGAVHVRQPGHLGTNAARNAGIRAAKSDLLVLVDDDVSAPPGWLAAHVDGAARHPGADVLGGPIRARLEGAPPRGCGREAPPITALDLGESDLEVERVWSANMALRRAAFERVGPFDESVQNGGEEENWLDRLRASGGKVVYLAAAGLDHRRSPEDSRLVPLMRAAYRRGRSVRVYDERRGEAPGLGRELAVLAGCGWHALRRGCPQGLVMGAHSAGRAVRAARPR